MTQFSRAVLLLSVVMCSSGAGASAQTYTCLSGTVWAASSLRDYVVRLVTGTDSASVATRTRYQLPATTASKVTVETSSTVCNKAGGAYHSAEVPAGTPAISRTLAVVKVGATRYVVLDPNERVGEYEVNIVFDSKWVMLVRFTS
jgi:hypothetical protein